ncbi:MAG TPA: hypothetical protein VG412_03265 [Acidimicrobiales bacterium]|nr:hypothetical protein [Acidimicrobiales bacterium]
MAVGAMDLPPEGMLLGGVALAGDPARGIEATEDLSLLFTTKGITVKGDNPATERHFAWSGLDAASCHGEVQRGGGRTATPLELTSAGQTIQFLLPSETVSPGQAAYLDQALPAWLERYGATDAPPVTAAPAGSTTPSGSPSTPTPPTPPTPTAKAPTPPAPTGKAATPPTPPTPAAPAAPAPAAPPAPSAPASPPLARSAAVEAAAAVMVTPPPTTAEEHIDPATGTLRRGDPLNSPGNQASSEGDSRAERKDRRKARSAAKAAGVPAGDQGAGGKTAATNRRTLMILIVILVLIVIAAVVYEVTKTKNSTTSTTTVPATSASLTVDKALASSVNLQLSDLPSGWAQALGSAPSISVTSSTGKATQKPATTAFATCLGASAATVGQVFGNTPSTDETVASTSPVFQESADNTIEMQSAVNVVRSTANAKSDATVFNKPGFLSCFTQFQTASAAALVPGTTAKVQQVQIAAPRGGSSYGFITTFTVPTQGTRVVGDAYMFGGRIEATLQPSTHGPDVPSDAFNSAYNAMLGRISANVGK